MKNLIAALVVCVALAAASFDADAAKRFGGGASLGRPAPTFSQTSPAAAPVSPAAQPRMNQSAQPKPAPAPAQKPSMMRSILGGVAAALGITALLSMLGIGGAGMASLLTGLLLAVVVFFVARMFLVRRRPQPAAGPSQTYDEASAPEAPARYETAQPSSNVRSGSLLDQLGGAASQNVAAQNPVDVTPADFDREAFLKMARENYVKLQQAWSTGNVIEMSDFTSNEIFTAVTHQLRERKGEVYTTQVKTLSDELLGIAQEAGNYYASVRFVGTLVINGEAEDLDETWVLEKPVEGDRGWLLCAIRQNGENA